jgi:hypothetical protein
VRRKLESTGHTGIRSAPGSRDQESAGQLQRVFGRTGQFSLLVGVNVLVGGMLGQDPTVLPLIARQVFHLEALTPALTFIVAFGVVKAATNFAAGTAGFPSGKRHGLRAGDHLFDDLRCADDRGALRELLLRDPARLGAGSAQPHLAAVVDELAV